MKMFYFTLIANFCLLFLIINAEHEDLLLEQEKLMAAPLFDNFIRTYEKNYETQEEHEYRLNIFVQNLKKAETLQKRGQGTAEYGVTQFSDLTETEFKKLYSKTDPRLKTQNPFPTAKIPKVKIPKHFDWRKKHVVSEVKSQGLCGSCWAFATTGNIESQWAIKHKKLYSLSEQELLDCDEVDEACEGGFMDNAYEAVMKLGGLETETSYPYMESNQTCKFKKTKVVVKISGAVNIPPNEKKMAKWLVKNGPIAIALNSADMHMYVKGIAHPNSSDCKKDDTSIDHGVLIVGLGVEKNIPYWIIKNSWGTNWGEHGYYRIFRGNNSCGLTYNPSSTVL